MRVIAIVNQKGGCGKTTTTVNLAGALAADGLRVLVVDLDPQAHASLALGIDPESVEVWIFDLDNTLYPKASGLFLGFARMMNSRLFKGNMHFQALGTNFRVWSDGIVSPLFEELDAACKLIAKEYDMNREGLWPEFREISREHNTRC